MIGDSVVRCADCQQVVGLPGGSHHQCEAPKPPDLLPFQRYIEAHYRDPRQRRMAYLCYSDWFISMANRCR